MKNISGPHIAAFRKEAGWDYQTLSSELMNKGINLNEKELQQIETGTRRVTDIEIYGFCCVFTCTFAELLHQ